MTQSSNWPEGVTTLKYYSFTPVELTEALSSIEAISPGVSQRIIDTWKDVPLGGSADEKIYLQLLADLDALVLQYLSDEPDGHEKVSKAFFLRRAIISATRVYPPD